MKKWISILLICLLAAALAVPAMAEEEPNEAPAGIELGEGFTASEAINDDGNVVTTITDQNGNSFTVEEVEGPINADEDYVDENGNDDLDPTPTPEPTAAPAPTAEPTPEPAPEAPTPEPSGTHLGTIAIVVVVVCAAAAAAILLIRKKKP